MSTVAEKLAPYAKMLGEVPDAKIAEMAGVSPSSVARFRRGHEEEEGAEAEEEEEEEEEEVPKAVAIRLLAPLPIRGRGFFPASIYEGEIAAQIVALVGADSPLIEVIA